MAKSSSTELDEAISEEVDHQSLFEHYSSLTEEIVEANKGRIPVSHQKAAYLMTKDGEILLETVTEDAFLQTIANQNAQFSAGDLLFEIRTNQNVAYIPLSDATTYGADLDSHPDVEYFSLALKAPQYKIEIGECSDGFGNSGRGNRLMYGEIHEAEDFFCQFIGGSDCKIKVWTVTKLRRRGKGGRSYSEKADFLEHEVTLDFNPRSGFGETQVGNDFNVSRISDDFRNLNNGTVVRFFGGGRHHVSEGNHRDWKGNCVSQPVI